MPFPSGRLRILDFVTATYIYLFVCTHFSSIEFSLFFFKLIFSVTVFGWESMIPLGFLAATGYVFIH